MKTILTSLVLLMAATGSRADTGDSTAATAAALKGRMEIFGYETRATYTHGALDEGDTAREFTTLRAGVSYQIAVEGARGATDVDVRIYDENGNMVGSDTDGSNVALVNINPRWTGRFLIVVTMADTRRGDGSFVIQTASR